MDVPQSRPNVFAGAATLVIIALGVLVAVGAIYWIVKTARARGFGTDLDMQKLIQQATSVAPAPAPAPATAPSFPVAELPDPDPAPAPVESSTCTEAPPSAVQPVLASDRQSDMTSATQAMADNDAFVGGLVREIIAASTSRQQTDKYAGAIASVLSNEDAGSVAAGISPMFGQDQTAASSAQTATLASALCSGDSTTARQMAGSDDANLMAMYQEIVNSLAGSTVISDKTRMLLSYLQMHKCQSDFASDPSAMAACLSSHAASYAPVNAAPMAMPQTPMSNVQVSSSGLMSLQAAPTNIAPAPATSTATIMPAAAASVAPVTVAPVTPVTSVTPAPTTVAPVAPVASGP